MTIPIYRNWAIVIFRLHYGVIALILSFALKFFALTHLLNSNTTNSCFVAALYFITYHALARLTAVSIVFTEPYSRDDKTSKVKPIAQTFTYKEVIGAFVWGLLPLVGLMYYKWQFIFVLVPLTILRLYSAAYFKKWIDGYTGDCLGAVEQFAELIIILSFVAL